MEEDKSNPEPLEKNRWKLLMNVVMIVFFLITIFLLAYIVYLYYPLKQQILDCNKINPNITGWVNLTLNKSLMP